MRNRLTSLATAIVLLGSVIPGSGVFAWDHPGHMLTASIAFSEIERERPDLIEKFMLLFLAHPDAGPLWVAVGDAKGKERVRRMFIECARWADDIKFTASDRPTWHSARWAVVADDAPPEARAAVELRHGMTAGQALEALALNYATVASAESSPKERALGLCWTLHIVGDIHEPMHVADLYSQLYPDGNFAGTISYVEDPVSKSAIPLHVLWDSNSIRIPTLAEVDRYTPLLLEKYPRSSFPELVEHPVSAQNRFQAWAREGYQVAADWGFAVESLPDPNKNQSSDQLVKNMVAFILDGISPVKDAPTLPEGYWDRLQDTAQRRITLAGYRIADLLISAAEQVEAQTNSVGR